MEYRKSQFPAGEQQLLEQETLLPCEWAPKVDRIILLASWDKGWTISDRLAWRYWLGLFFLGLFGRLLELLGFEGKPAHAPEFPPPSQSWRERLAERLGLGRTMLDTRLGATFIVQTRLLWMAYRRWRNDEARDSYNKLLHENEKPRRELGEPPKEWKNPLVIQVIGTQDNFVSPQDQVDTDAEAAAWLRGDGMSKYFLLEMVGARHIEVVKFSNPQHSARQATFEAALTGDEPSLRTAGRDPAFFLDAPIKPDFSVKDAIFIIHGIRDDGYWTHRIAKAVKEEATKTNDSTPTYPSKDPAIKLNSLRSVTPTYGYFPMGAFILPWIRQQKVEWFMNLYVEVKARYPNSTMHYVGHSNGTYLVASALQNYAAARFGRIYFAGSVVHTKFEWSTVTDEKESRVQRFHNARGATDWAVALLPKSIDYFSDLGGGGFDGFEDARRDSERISQSDRFAWGGHSGAISEGHWPGIAKFIVTGAKPPEPLDLFKRVAGDSRAGLPPEDRVAVILSVLLDYVSRLRLLVPVVAIAIPSLLVFAIEWLFPCGDGREFVIPKYCLYALALAAPVWFIVYPKSPPAGWLAPALKFVIAVAILGLVGWFSFNLFALAFIQCGSVLAALALAALAGVILFVLTRF